MVEQDTSATQQKGLGQALVEYALILALLAVAFGAALAATGPAIGNVFCNVVHNLGGETASPQGGNCGHAAPDLSGGLPDVAHFWGTVTWVAQNPQDETPFPTPIRRAPTLVGSGATDTHTPTNTPTPTDTPTSTSTATSTTIPTPGPSPTQEDIAFSVPHVDQISNPDWWRLDTGDFMGNGAWEARWYSSRSTSNNAGGWRNISFPGSPVNITEITDINGVDFNWGNNAPPEMPGVTDNFGASFSRTIEVAQTATYRFTLLADDQANIHLDGNSTPFLWTTVWNQTKTATITIPAGTHTLRVDFAENGGGARVHVNIERLGSNPDDVVVDSNDCAWVQDDSTPGNAVSISNQFSNGLLTWPSGQTCYLELRGYVDLTSHSNPVLSFWDLWDFASGGASGQVQVSPYISDGLGGVDRSQLNWTTIATRSAGTSNYNWTRSQLDLSTLGIGDQVTLRFVIGGAGGGSPARWSIDDIQIVDALTAPNFTIGDEWDLNNRNQMRDFIYDSDTNKTLEDNPALPNTIEEWRWDLTSNNARSGTAWDDSPGYNYQKHTNGGPRIHYLEFARPIDLTAGTVPAADNEGDTGDPILSFWHAYDILTNASIRVEYTRDPIDTTAPRTWTTLPDGMLVDFTPPSGAPGANEQVARTNLSMQPVSMNLALIPGVDTDPFYLRFAIYVNSSATSFGQGWYIDDIRLERKNPTPFVAYPFFDDAENAAFMADMWITAGGAWGQDTAKNGANSSATAYSDSPSGNYSQNTTQYLELNGIIDLLHDTPANTIEGTRPPAVNPILSFWHQRRVGNNVNFAVDIWTEDAKTWSEVWAYDSSMRRQEAWQRMEINLAAALESISGKPWADISNNVDGTTDDDDIKVRFRFTSGGSSTQDGVYIDDIRIGDAPTVTHRLWPTANGGQGAFVENVEYTPTLLEPWYAHWYASGDWGVTSASGYTNNGSAMAFRDSSGSYEHYTYSPLELIPIIDMTGNMGGRVPILYFWTRFAIASNDYFTVEIAEEAPGDLTQSENKIGGWTAWTPQPMMVGVATDSTGINDTAVDTWLQGQVDLSSFVGKRIRLRFVMSAPNGSNRTDGVYLDDIAFTFRPTVLTTPFTDRAQTTINWVTEGIWGLGLDQYVGSGADQSVFGATQWTGTFFDCEQLRDPDPDAGESCGDPNTYSAILSRNTNFAPGDPVVTGNQPKIGPENVSSVVHDYGTADTPLGNSAGDWYLNTYAARWTRQVTIPPGTYSFRTLTDDGVRIYISDVADTNLTPISGGDPRGIILENWSNHAIAMDTGTFTVTGTSPITRTLTLEWFENSGDAVIELYATGASYSFTDSPNTPVGAGFATVNSIMPGNSSLMLKGFFNLSASNFSLYYKRQYQLPWNNTFYVETSTDGGFTWNTIGSETVTNATYVLQNNNGFQWQQRDVSLPQSANVMIRFRLDTRSAGTTDNGVYITDINVRSP